MSSAEYGKGVFQPFIHHPSLRRIKSHISDGDKFFLQKIREFLSFQIDQIIMKKDAHHIFLKKGLAFGNFHC